jgi:glutathione peroxidase
MTMVYDFEVKTLDGKLFRLEELKGRVLLIVNTASNCGYTPQYAGLQELHQNLETKGLSVLGFPCNQFGGQEPGSNEEIGQFCQKNFGVDFQMFEKIEVNGETAHPLFKYLTSEKTGLFGTESIKWNFTKFLVDKNGTVLKRYAPSVSPAEIGQDIEKIL